MGGYQLMTNSAAILRGRYREGYETAKPIAANKALAYRFAMPTANHVFLPGHRIMVQIQSSWFPLYDRNPQTFVPSIFDAKPADYKKATQRIYHDSFVELPGGGSGRGNRRIAAPGVRIPPSAGPPSPPQYQDLNNTNSASPHFPFK